MSEPQTDYDTDAGPTRFASAPWTPEEPDESGHAHVWSSDGALVAKVCDNPLYGETAHDRARLIAAAGTAAQEAREMGYDPVAVMENLPLYLDALAEVARDNGLTKDQHQTLARGALASAEGSSDE